MEARLIAGVNGGSRKMSWNYRRDLRDVEFDVDEFGEDEGRGRRSEKRSPLAERAICPRCRMLLSVFETRARTCATCHMEIEPLRK